MKKLMSLVLVTLTLMLEAKAQAPHAPKRMTCYAMNTAITYVIDLQEYAAFKGKATVNAYNGEWSESEILNGTRLHGFTKVQVDVHGRERDHFRQPKEEISLSLVLGSEDTMESVFGYYRYVSRFGKETVLEGGLRCVY